VRSISPFSPFGNFIYHPLSRGDCSLRAIVSAAAVESERECNVFPGGQVLQPGGRKQARREGLSQPNHRRRRLRRRVYGPRPSPIGAADEREEGKEERERERERERRCPRALSRSLFFRERQ